jgi:hypothetical protein
MILARFRVIFYIKICFNPKALVFKVAFFIVERVLERKSLKVELNMEGEKRLNDDIHDEDVEEFWVTYFIAKGLF